MELFVSAKTKSGFETALSNGTVSADALAFINDTNQAYEKGNYHNFIPRGGQEKQVLTWKEDGAAQWESLANIFNGLEEFLCYGVEWDVTVGDPHITRIGNMSLHKTLPIQSQLKGCIAQGNTVMYWLNAEDWRFKKNPSTASVSLTVSGSTYTMVSNLFSNLRYEKQYIKVQGVICQIDSIDTDINTATLLVNDKLTALGLTTGVQEIELGAVLNGYDGTVRVYCPGFYIKSVIIGNIRRVWLSTVKIDATWVYQNEILLDAYRCTVLNTVPDNMGYLSTLPQNSTISVVNTNTYCRGGSNNADLDKYLTGADETTIDIFRTDLGKPRTNISRATMRTYAANASSQLLSYDQYKNIFYWLYVVEYANFNCQETFKDTLTTEGYHQGGLGNGITNMSNWNGYFGGIYDPITPCGYGNSIGNGTGIIALTIPTFTYTDTEGGTSIQNTQTIYMSRWRGFDNPFGDIWTNLDGIIVDADANNHPNNMNYVYTCQDPSKYADNLNGGGYRKVGEEYHENGYIKTFDLGNAAHIIPNANGGSTTTYKCDHHYVGDASTTLCTVRVGGAADDGGYAGLGYFYSAGGVSGSASSIGFRSVSASSSSVFLSDEAVV